jgi:hydrogenase nickel incorporation protein HypA/HybF
LLIEERAMHELSIALSMIEQIEQLAAKNPGVIRSVQVRIGALSGVDADALAFAWEIARAGTPAGEAQLAIERIPLRVRCPQCGQTHSPAVMSVACPRCITPEQEIVAGRELELTSLEIDA